MSENQDLQEQMQEAISVNSKNKFLAISLEKSNAIAQTTKYYKNKCISLPHPRPNSALGTCDFYKLVVGGDLFVDKSLMIKELLDDKSEAILITRPRRWGKSINMSMIHRFFEIEVDRKGHVLPNKRRVNQRLFLGGSIDAKKLNPLAIASVPYAVQKQGKFPVIFLSLKDIKGKNYHEIESGLSNVIKKVFYDHRYLQESKEMDSNIRAVFEQYLSNNIDLIQLKESLYFLSMLLFEYFKQKVYILIDEYDTPINEAYCKFGATRDFENVLELFRGIFGSCLKGNEYLEKGIITGILRIAKADLFSDLNNITEYTVLDNNFSKFYGFTESEVSELLSKAPVEIEQTKIREWYNGYKIGEELLYNPWSIMRCIVQNKLDHYWVDSGGTALIDTTSRLIIPVTDLTSKDQAIKLFDSKDSYSPHIRVADVLLATTAAPTYFKSVSNAKYVEGYSEPEEVLYAYADGGLGANRPAYEALKLLKSGKSREQQKEILDKSMVLSLNFDKDTGSSSLIPKVGFDGIIGWLVKGNLVSRLMNSTEDSSTEEVRVDLPGSDEFYEVKLPITKETKSLDNASSKNIAALEEVGRKYINEHAPQLQKLCDNLLYNYNQEQNIKAIASTASALDDKVVVTSDDELSKIDTKLLDSDDKKLDQASMINEENKDYVINEIKDYLHDFVKSNPDLKESVDNFIGSIEQYSNQELSKLIEDISATQKLVTEMSTIEANSVLAPYMNCGLESREDISLEGEDDIEDHAGYNEIIA